LLQINLAQKSYDETKGFPYFHCWMEVCHTEKFQSVYEAMKQAQENRQSKSTTHRKKHKKMTVNLPNDLQVANNQNRNKKETMEKINMPCNLQPLYK